MKDLLCNSIEELKEKNILLADNQEPLLKNNLAKILEEKNILPIDIANLIGISRQSINFILNNNTKPSIEIALKLSYVLNIPLEEMFILNKEYWFTSTINQTERDRTYYINTISGEVVDSNQKKEFIKRNKGEYYNKVDKIYISKKQRDSLSKEYQEKYTKVFIKLVKKFKPIVLGG